MPVQPQPLLDRVLALCRVDFAPVHWQPSAARVVAATIVSIAGSLAADAALVAIGTAVFPSTRGYVHFQFHDYARLTVIGVVIACLAWPVVTRISSQPRWLFFRLAVLVTLVLWLPDLYILVKGQPPEAVAVLMSMHLAIAVITYNCLVHLAKVGAMSTPGRRTVAEGTRRSLQPHARPFPQNDQHRGNGAGQRPREATLDPGAATDTPARYQQPGQSLPGPGAGHRLRDAGGHVRIIDDPDYGEWSGRQRDEQS